MCVCGEILNLAQSGLKMAAALHDEKFLIRKLFLGHHRQTGKERRTLFWSGIDKGDVLRLTL